MKKFLAIFLALLMCLGVLASCAGNQETGATLEEAKASLEANMKDMDGKVFANDYDIQGKVMVGTTEFKVTWTVDNANIKIKESSKAGFWTVDLPNVNDKEVEYKLTATIENADGDTIKTSFTHKLAVINNANLETEFKEGVEYKAYIKQVNLGYDVYVLNTTQNDENKFINTTMDPKEAAVFKFEKVYQIFHCFPRKKTALVVRGIYGFSGGIPDIQLCAVVRRKTGNGVAFSVVLGKVICSDDLL